ncbi:MAG: dienelactone hydrolase family protein [Bacteroidota bacterium]
MNKRLSKFLKIIGITAMLLYLGICALLYFNQDELLFHPQPTSKQEIAEIIKTYPEFDTLCFTMKDGNRTYGFISKDTLQEKLPLVLYFGGNAEEVSHLADYKTYFPHTIMVMLNYRGFGLSKGIVSEKTMFGDALEAYDKLITKPEIDADKVIVIGRSIGTGIATYLSSQRKTKATILITPYENMIDVAFEKYPFVPIGLLIKHPFESDKYAKTITTPVLALIAKNDEVIPKHHAYNLMGVWKGKTAVLEVDEDHNSIMGNEAVWQRIELFVKENNK